MEEEVGEALCSGTEKPAADPALEDALERDLRRVGEAPLERRRHRAHAGQPDEPAAFRGGDDRRRDVRYTEQLPVRDSRDTFGLGSRRQPQMRSES